MSLFSFGFKKAKTEGDTKVGGGGDGIGVQETGFAASGPKKSLKTSTAKKKKKVSKATEVRKEEEVEVLDVDGDDEMEDRITRENGMTKKASLLKPKSSGKGKKRKKVIVDSDDEGDGDYQDDGASEKDDDVLMLVDSDSEDDVKKTNLKKKKKSKTVTSTPAKSSGTSWLSSSTPKSSTSAKSSSGKKPSREKPSLLTPVNSKSKSKTSAMSPPASPKIGVLETGDHEHNKLPWLQPERIMDAERRRPDDPNYDPTTLFVPQGYLDGKPEYHAPDGKPRKITPAMRIWWEFKSQVFDTVLFFKVGKFYELYHMDADVAVKHTSMMYMKGDIAHSGFPEKAYGKFSEQLVQLGYRVSRVEQTETPAEMQQRTKKKSGCVRREVCAVLSPGTRTISVRDGIYGRVDTERVSLMGLYESPLSDGTGTAIGIALLDPTIGRISFGSFVDEKNRTRLRMLLAKETPAEIAFSKDNVGNNSVALIGHSCPHILGVTHSTMHTKVTGISNDAGIESKNTVSLLTAAKNGYFAEPNSKVQLGDLPTQLQFLVSEVDGAIFPKSSFEAQVALSALGVILRVMKRAFIDHQIITLKNFACYKLPGSDVAEDKAQTDDVPAGSRLVLDGQALSNLEIFNTSSTVEGSLFKYLDKCTTKFGKRLLREWIGSPLQSRTEIIARQRQVQAAMTLHSNNSDAFQMFRKKTKSLPDLERMLARIHTLGLKHLDSHPDSRAVLYDSKSYNKTKIESLCKTLDGMLILQNVLSKLGEQVAEQQLDCLKKFCILSSGEGCASMDQALDAFQCSFDIKQGKSDGSITPNRGVIDSYDAALDALDTIKLEFDQILEEARDKLDIKSAKDRKRVKFWSPGVGKDRYQIEVPADLELAGPPGWAMKTRTGSCTRYHNSSITRLLKKLELAEVELDKQAEDATRLVFAKFDEHRGLWSQAVDAAKYFDCIVSLAVVSHDDNTDENPMCMPEIISPTESTGSILELENCRHPCVAQMLEKKGVSFIPNDLVIGGKQPCLLLTGPNMGGKSTLLRQTCIAVVMAQIGCMVAASSCRLTPVDRIFTRLGASDRIMEGQSTFFVELDETATVLHHATSRSLVILDELGRGTSTFDGTAIAYAVVEKLCKPSLRCMTMFATHYHSLIQEYKTCDLVKTGHMSCFANSEGRSDDVTFLHKLAPGVADKSHGLNVARLAKLPEEIIQIASEESERFEHNFQIEQLYMELKRAVNSQATTEEILALQKRAKSIIS
eukprot:CAMPEP_0203752334 /NCGR_PEP_ID=MMETSP0098-20131031/6265_1 /ASSEMBLY_ACC=CAM_ASM_000208 /TAXON_ID=96639 /ORGANISM=" , Strain NY0313808BC1" /LENGTH=1243 /DNA_ID=CAMNT_0050642437 /DNA_START=330 /DNA_END=4058 /DNA_ORIENTATION=+